MKPTEDIFYRYKFETYAGSKHQCPDCQMMTFVYYVDSINGDCPVSPIVGKCERINGCGYNKTPYEFFNDNGIINDTRHTFDYVNARLLAIEKPVDYISEKIVKRTFEKTANTFTNFLYKYLNNDIETLVLLVKKYNLGTLKDSVIYWQQDLQGRYRTGKIMQYDWKGKRYKDIVPSWAHKKIDNKNFNLKQCLFGEHLIADAKQVIIVESEKSSVILANEYRNNKGIVILATGGIHNLTVDKFKIFVDLNLPITLLPDIGAEKLWTSKMEKIKTKLGLDIVLYDTDFFQKRIFKNQFFHFKEGQDIADYLISRKYGEAYI